MSGFGMGLSSALLLAVELAERPTLSAVMRQQPLPPDVLTLIKIAGGADEVGAEAARRVRRNPLFVRDASILYLQTVVLSPHADAYRTLGARPESSQAELREHLRWLMKWLHPDRAKSEWESAFAERVLAAWDSLKSPDRRADYDSKRAQSRQSTARPGKSTGRPRRLLPGLILMDAPAGAGRHHVPWAIATGIAMVALAATLWVLLVPHTGWLTSVALTGSNPVAEASQESPVAE